MANDLQAKYEVDPYQQDLLRAIRDGNGSAFDPNLVPATIARLKILESLGLIARDEEWAKGQLCYVITDAGGKLIGEDATPPVTTASAVTAADWKIAPLGEGPFDAELSFQEKADIKTVIDAITTAHYSAVTTEAALLTVGAAATPILSLQLPEWMVVDRNEGEGWISMGVCDGAKLLAAVRKTKNGLAINAYPDRSMDIENASRFAIALQHAVAIATALAAGTGGAT